MNPLRLVGTVVVIFIVAVYLVLAPLAGYKLNQDGIRRNRESADLLCGVLTDVVATAYSSSAAPVDLSKLPARTRQLLADLAPYIMAQRAAQAKNKSTKGATAEERVLSKLHRIPNC